MSLTRFRHLAIEGAKPAPTAADIEAKEALLGACLPASFRAYLDVANGGYLEYSIDVDTGGGRMVFLDLSPGGGGAVVAFVQGLPAWTARRVESAFVKIASSFDDYVDKLQIDRDAVIDHLSHDVTEPSHIEAHEEWLDIGLPNWRDDRELAHAVAEARARVRA
jgi:hypothetical protein